MVFRGISNDLWGIQGRYGGIMEIKRRFRGLMEGTQVPFEVVSKGFMDVSRRFRGLQGLSNAF